MNVSSERGIKGMLSRASIIQQSVLILSIYGNFKEGSLARHDLFDDCAVTREQNKHNSRT